MGRRATSRRPEGSNRQKSIRSALAEKTAKFTPRPSQLAPSGPGRPGSSRSGMGGISAGQFGTDAGGGHSPPRDEHHGRERRQQEGDRLVEAVARHRLRLHG